MSPRVQIACAITGPAAIVLFLVAFWGIGGFIPPTAPTDSADSVAQFYADDRDAIRLGMVIGIPAAVLLLPFYVGVSAALARIEDRRFPVLSILQVCGAVILLVFFLVCMLVWITASYRADANPDDVRSLHDLGWLVFVMVWPEYTISMGVIAVLVLKDDGRRGPWPRWFGYLAAWTALSGAGGSLAVFFKDGAFAWNGLIGFYVPIAVFVIFTSICCWFMVTDARRRQPEPQATAPVSELSRA